MGYSTQSIPFFVDTITIQPHTATHAKHLNRKVSIKSFSRGAPCYLEQVCESRGGSAGDYIVRLQNGDFMQGPEV